MEVVVRLGFAVTVLDERAGGGFAEVVWGGFTPAETLDLVFKGARFTPSDTEARGREAEEVAEPVGETTDGRVALLVGAGFAPTDADNEGFESGGADGFAGATESLRLEGTVEVASGREVIGVFEGIADELVDFLRVGATAGLAVAELAVAVGLEEATLTAPAPNVPELMICVYKYYVNIV